MELQGLKVSHTKFGYGKIVKVKDALFDVQFENGEIKHFIYPNSLSMGILKLENEELHTQIEVDYNQKTEEERLKLALREKKEALRRKLRKRKKREMSRALIEERRQKDQKERRTRLYQTAYHEAGHTIVGELLIPNSVTEAVVYYSGEGRTYFKRATFSSLKKKDVENEIMIYLAGRAAVEVAYGIFERDWVVSDCEQIRYCLNKMLDKYYAKESEKLDYGSGAYNRLEEKKRKQQPIVLEYYYEKTKQLIRNNRRFLDEVARKLATDKSLKEEEIQSLKRKFIA